MNENDYIRVSNKTNLRVIKDCVRDMLSGDEYYVSKEDLEQLQNLVYKMWDRSIGKIIAEDNEGGNGE